MWSEAPVPLDVRRLSGAGEGGSYDPGWPDPLLSWVGDVWAEVGYGATGPLLSRVVDLWAEVGYEEPAAPGDPLLASRGSLLIAEVAHTPTAGQRRTATIVAEVAVTGTLDPLVKPGGSYASLAAAEVAFKETPGARKEAGIIVEVAVT